MSHLENVRGSKSPDASYIGMETTDIWRSAAELVKIYGAGAEFAAAREADGALGRGDIDDFRIWVNIGNVTGELLRHRSTTTDPIN